MQFGHILHAPSRVSVGCVVRPLLSRQGFTRLIQKKVGGAGRLADFQSEILLAKPANGQPTCRVKSGEQSELTQLKGTRPELKTRMYPACNHPSYNKEKPKTDSRKIGNSGKRLTI